MNEARAVVNHNVIPMRAEPNDAAERVSELLFGETASMLADEGDYSQVRSADSYTGWVLSRHLVVMETGEVYPNPVRAAVVAPLFLPVFREPSGRSERKTLLTLGTPVELAVGDAEAEYYPIRFPNAETGYLEGSALIIPRYPPLESIGPNLVTVARGLIGVPYLWGGRTPFGIDCSGLVQRVYSLCGLTLPRDAYLQAAWERFHSVDRDALHEGDLVFFAGEKDPRHRGVTHVGIVAGEERFIHAAGESGVTFSRLSDLPYARQYWGARRIDPTEHRGTDDGPV